MMRIAVLFLILFICAGKQNLSAQDLQECDTVKMLNQDLRVDSLISMHRKAMEINLDHVEHDGIDGFRVQIFMESGNNSKNKALWMKNEFDRRYSYIPSYIIFGEPYYRIRVGDFRTRLEAEAFMRRIVRHYSNAFVIKDKIKFPKLLNN